MRPLTIITAITALMLAISGAASGANAMTEAGRQTAALCATATRAAEIDAAVPRGLLTAISLKESGRWDSDKKQSVAWPWTVTAAGAGAHYPTKQEALNAVTALQARGVTNIDVGCMQINLRYHPHAFKDLETALDPTHNAAYAGDHLRQLREDHRSWPSAVERYRSSDPKRRLAYRRAVYKLKYAVLSESPRAAAAKGRANWKVRQATLRRKYAAAKKARAKNVRRIRETKIKQRKQLRAGFEARKAKVLREWNEMLRKRRQKLRGNRS